MPKDGWPWRTNQRLERVVVPARGEQTVRLWLEPAAAGAHWVRLWIEGDSFQADNRAALAFVCVEREKVLLAGAPADYGFLPAALSPAEDGSLSGLVPVFAPPAQAEAALADARPAPPWPRR